MQLLSADSVPAARWKRGRECGAESWQEQNDRAISESGGASAGRKQGREVVTESWEKDSERAISESGLALKLARFGGESDAVRTREMKLALGSTPTLKVCSETNCKDSRATICQDDGGTKCKDEEETACRDEDDGERRNPLDRVGVDIFQTGILPRLDARSLARSTAVCSRWRLLALVDSLWQPLLKAYFAQRAHLPLCLVGRDLSQSPKQHLLYGVAVAESRQEALVAAEMCGRIWELRLKPPVGPYWLAFDPTQDGKPGLNRYFTCNGRLNSDPGDPIWGGHGCVWEFIRLEAPGRGRGPAEEASVGVRVNHWPAMAPRRLPDGRWVLENLYGLYVTRPDNPAFAASDAGLNRSRSSERRRSCRNACEPPLYGLQI